MAQDRYFPVSVTIRARDAESGRRLDNVGVSGEPFHGVSGDPFHLPNRCFYSVGTAGVEGGGLRVSLVAVRPFSIEVSSEGYAPQTVRIDRHTEDEIVVPLTRAPPTTGPE